MKEIALSVALLSLVSGVSAGEWVAVGAPVKSAPATAAVGAGMAVVPATQAPAVVAPVSASPSENGLLNELLMQVEQMQQEIARLRGTVETQSLKIRRLEQDGETRYLDLDRRLVFLSTASGAFSLAPAEVAQAPVVAEPSDPASIPAPAVSADMTGSADDDYNSAMALLRNNQFDEARAAFEQFSSKYSGNPLAANAYYWIGEICLVREELPAALTSFRKVIDDFGGHVKVADATYKYAVALDKSGDQAGAREWLKTVISRYTGKSDSTVRLAQAYLDKLPASQ